MKPFSDLDPLLHSPLRLAIISLLMSVEEAEFTFIKDKTGATAGNLSVQITRLKEAGYINVSKRFSENYPQTKCKMTDFGKTRFIEYVKTLEEYLKPGKMN